VLVFVTQEPIANGTNIMTLTEIQTATPGPVRMAAVIHEPRKFVAYASAGTVIDCPSYAWDESDQAAMLDLRNAFGEDLVSTHREELDRAARRLIETHLVIEWRDRGYTGVVFVHDRSAFEAGATPGPDGLEYAEPDNDAYQQVWRTAANAITDKELVAEADLTDVFPLRTDLDRHRDALHHRLNEWASDDMCDHAEQQLDGLRAAVDGAVTRSQLIELSALIA
jgi:hypothetical protein